MSKDSKREKGEGFIRRLYAVSATPVRAVRLSAFASIKNQKQNLKHGGNGGQKSEGTEDFKKGPGRQKAFATRGQHNRTSPFPQISVLRFLRVSGLAFVF